MMLKDGFFEEEMFTLCSPRSLRSVDVLHDYHGMNIRPLSFMYNIDFEFPGSGCCVAIDLLTSGTPMKSSTTVLSEIH